MSKTADEKEHAPSLTLEGLETLAEEFARAWVYGRLTPEEDTQPTELNLRQRVLPFLKLAAEIGLRHEAKDVELREAAEALLSEQRAKTWGDRKPLPYYRVSAKKMEALRKALEGMEVEGS